MPINWSEITTEDLIADIQRADHVTDHISGAIAEYERRCGKDWKRYNPSLYRAVVR